MDTYDLKKSIKTVSISVVLCWVCGLGTTFIIIGAPLLFIDWILGTQLTNSFENLIFSGSEIYRHFKIALTGIPLFCTYARSKGWQI